MIRHNLAYKLLALVAAIIIWIYVNDFQPSNETQNHKNPIISLRVPLKADRLASDLLVTNMPSEVTVQVEGRPEDIVGLSAEQDEITAYLYLHGQSAGSCHVPVIVKLPDPFVGMRKKAVPDAVDVVLVKKEQRRLRIEPIFLGAPPDTHRFSAPSISPENATISGASENVRSVRRLAVKLDTEKLSDVGLDADFTILALDSSGKRVKGLEIHPQMAHVLVGPAEGLSKRVAFVKLNTAGHSLPYVVTGITVVPQEVEVSGKASDLANLDMIPTEPLQLSGRTQTFTQRLRLLPPPGVILPDGDYVDVTVRIRPAGAPGNG
jgi:YbbR domain-containing protein